MIENLTKTTTAEALLASVEMIEALACLLGHVPIVESAEFRHLNQARERTTAGAANRVGRGLHHV
ncbi:hypothetical protein [Methylobacterium bullatum]|uniref:hypothetical protein n=1 Tax=Methylobacterium bullatum TaxID=570505 RepID=UPI0030CC5F2F